MSTRSMWSGALFGALTVALVATVAAVVVAFKDGNPLYVRNVGLFSVGTLTLTAIAFFTAAAIATVARRRHL